MRYPSLPMHHSSGGDSTDSKKQLSVHQPFEKNSTGPSNGYALEQQSFQSANQITKSHQDYEIEQQSLQSANQITTTRSSKGFNANISGPKVDCFIGKTINADKLGCSNSSGGMLEDGIRVSDGQLVCKEPVYDSNYDGNSDAGKKTYATEGSFEAENGGKRKRRGHIETPEGGRDCAYDIRACLFHTACILGLLLLVSIGAFAYYFIQCQKKQNEVERLYADIAQLNSTEFKCDIVPDNCAPLRASNDHLSGVNMQLNESVAELQTRNQNLLNEVERLHNQLDQLLANIEGLDGDVNGLLDNLDQYEELNSQLSESVEELERQNQILNNSNIWYTDLNSQLNESIAEFQTQNEFLAEQNQIYAGLNGDLNATAGKLSGEVDRLENAVESLGKENENLTNSVNSLSDEVDELGVLNDELEHSATDLKIQVDKLSNEVDRLEGLNDKLENVLSFLNETANNFDETFEAITSFLSEQITAYRSVVLETLQNTYSQRIANWDCAYRDMFRLEDFASDGRLPIGASSYPDVIEYVDERVLSELCLSKQDFEIYLDNRFVQQGVHPPVSATTNNLLSSVQLYTMAAMTYYFPDSGDVGGLSNAEWSDASYSCENLPAEKRFSM